MSLTRWTRGPWTEAEDPETADDLKEVESGGQAVSLDYFFLGTSHPKRKRAMAPSATSTRMVVRTSKQVVLPANGTRATLNTQYERLIRVTLAEGAFYHHQQKGVRSKRRTPIQHWPSAKFWKPRVKGIGSSKTSMPSSNHGATKDEVHISSLSSNGHGCNAGGNCANTWWNTFARTTTDMTDQQVGRTEHAGHAIRDLINAMQLNLDSNLESTSNLKMQ